MHTDNLELSRNLSFMLAATTKADNVQNLVCLASNHVVQLNFWYLKLKKQKFWQIAWGTLKWLQTASTVQVPLQKQFSVIPFWYICAIFILHNFIFLGCSRVTYFWCFISVKHSTIFSLGLYMGFKKNSN